MAVDGIENVIRMLEEIEDGRLPEADFLELSACTQGCVGGCFDVENPYAAKMRLRGLMKGLPETRSSFTLQGPAQEIVRRDKQLQYLPAFLLDEDREAAMAKQLRIQALESHLPGLHCGSCGPLPAMPLRRMWCWAVPLRTTASSKYGPGCGIWPEKAGQMSTCPLPSAASSPYITTEHGRRKKHGSCGGRVFVFPDGGFRP